MLKIHIIYNLFTWATVIFLLLLSLAGRSQSMPDTLSMYQFLNWSQQNALGKQEAQLNIDLAELDAQILQARLKPQINGFANIPNYNRTFSPVTQPNGSIAFQSVSNNNSSIGLSVTQELPLTGGAVFVQSNLQRFDDFDSDFHSYNGVPLRVGLIQPLFGFNSLKWEKKLAPLRLKEASKQFLADKEAINLEAARLFLNLLSIQNEQQIFEANKASNETLYKIAQERFQLGKISQSDLMRLELELLSADKELKRIRQQVRTASAAIYNYLGIRYNGEQLGVHFPEVNDEIVLNKQEILQKGLANRPELTAVLRQKMEAERDLAQAKGNGGLQANLNASFGFVRSAMEVGDIYADPQQEQLIALQLNVPILDWGLQKNNVQRASLQSAFVNVSAHRAELQFETDIKNAIAAFDNLQTEVKLAKEVLDIALKRFEIATESYVLGAISITELTIARQEKDQASRAYLDTLSRYWNSYYNLRFLTLYDFE